MSRLVYFEIQADDPEATTAFYAAVFGWTAERDPALPIPYWRIEAHGMRGGILQRPAPVPAGSHGTNAYVCSFEVADFDVTAEAIQARGGRVAMDKFAIPGVCWQGYFLDPAGNTFGLVQPDPEAA